jgi:hypothetical protein
LTGHKSALGDWGALDICAAAVRHEPQGRIFINPRYCFGLRAEITNALLHSVRECNLYSQFESSFSWIGSNCVRGLSISLIWGRKPIVREQIHPHIQICQVKTGLRSMERSPVWWRTALTRYKAAHYVCLA